MGLPIALHSSLMAFLDHIFKGRDGILIHRGRDDKTSLSKVETGFHCFIIIKRPSYIHGPLEITFRQSTASWNLKIKYPFSRAWISNLPAGAHIRSKLALRWL